MCPQPVETLGVLPSHLSKPDRMKVVANWKICYRHKLTLELIVCSPDSHALAVLEELGILEGNEYVEVNLDPAYDQEAA
jgi:hypothetical protein